MEFRFRHADVSTCLSTSSYIPWNVLRYETHAEVEICEVEAENYY